MPKRDEIGQEREKKILVPNSVYTRPRQENSETNCKKFRKEIGEKNLFPNSVHTRPVEENFEKNSKTFQKIKKPLSGIIFSQNEMK